MSSSIRIWSRAINALVILTSVAYSTAFAAEIQAKLLGSANDAPSISAVLPALTDKDFSTLSERSLHTKVHEIGMGRVLPKKIAQLDLQSLAWKLSGDKQFATIEIKATDAAALRVGLDRRSYAKGLTVLTYGPTYPELIYGPFTSAELRAPLDSEPYWLPVVEGDTVRLELQLDADVIASGKFAMPVVSHLVTSVRNTKAKNLSDMGRSGSCNIDIACAPTNPNWVSRGDAVAKYYVTSTTGGTGICTGTLLSNTSSATPIPAYFITANHCVASNARSSTMHFYWFFQRAACSLTNPVNPTTVTETVGGATFLATVAANDTTLVSLNNRPPAGAVFSAWKNTAVTIGESLVALHHPSGDLKKYSAGTMQSFTTYLDNGSGNNHIKMLWNQGTTEAGSSGSGLFNASGELVGTLHGGDAACGANQTQPDWYGRFEQAFPTLRPWLAPVGPSEPPAPPTPPAPTIPISVALNAGVATPGSVTLRNSIWYRIDTSAGTNSLTVTLTGLNGDADLYLYRNGVTDTPNCGSDELGNTSETCTISSPGAATWYIEVYGYEAANYTVTASTNSGIPVDSGGGGGGGSMDTTLLALLGLLALLQANRARRYRVRH